MKKRVLYALLFLIILLSGCKQEKIVIKDVVIGESEEGQHTVSFFAINKNKEIGDCFAKIVLNQKTYSIHNLGIIKPGEKTFFETDIKFENGGTSIKVLAGCDWVTQEETTICNNKTWLERKLCRLTFNKPELQQCLQNKDLEYKFFCIGLINNDSELCQYTKSGSKEIWCKAYITKNVDLCNTIQNSKEKDWCFTDIGMNLRDSQICDKITDQKSQTSCIAVAKEDPELCLKGADEYKLNCILSIIESTSNKELCNLLGNRKEECLEQIK